jgi:hypothetical protein
MESTFEERQKVARDQCRAGGHDLNPVTGLGGVPLVILCSRCGARWRIHPDDRGLTWGSQIDTGPRLDSNV